MALLLNIELGARHQLVEKTPNHWLEIVIHLNFYLPLDNPTNFQWCIENCHIWSHANFVEYASCNFQAQWRSVLPIPSKLLAQSAANPSDYCGVFPKKF